MRKIDINCDMGESYGNYSLGLDNKVIPYITSANIACGYHASDPVVMQETVRLAKAHKVGIGAHPGFLDLMGFGRREMNLSYQEAKAYVQYQIGALMAFCISEKVPLTHVKLHGALYNMAAKDYTLSKAVCEGIYEIDPNLIIYAMGNSETIRAAKEIGIPYFKEVFADRAYEEDGSLVDRKKEGSMITDENIAISRIVRIIKEGKVTAITGKDISIDCDTVCIHGDGIKAVEFAKKLHEAIIIESLLA